MRKLYKPCLKDVAYEIPLYFGLLVHEKNSFGFPYISLCKIKSPLVAKFIFMRSLQTLFQGCCIYNSFVFGLMVHEKQSFKCISLGLYKPM